MTKPDARTCVRTYKRRGSSSAANAVSHRVGYLAAQFYVNAEPGGDQAAGPLPVAVVGFRAAGRPFSTDRRVLSPIAAAGTACRATRRTNRLRSRSKCRARRRESGSRGPG